MSINWNGVFPAITTKFTKNDNLDLELFTKNLEFQLAAGIHGIVLGGTLGEASVLTAAEKEKLVRHTVKVLNGKIPVILNVAEGSTAEAINQVKLAKEWGADGIMLLPPMRYKPDHRETVTYLKTIAKSTDLPIMIYNNPIDYKTEITLEIFEELAECANIQAIKESTREITNVTRLKNKFGDRFKILCGVDTIGMEEIMMGADGWIGGLVCAFPKETVAIYELTKAGKIEEALKIHRWFLPLCELDLHPKLVQYIKLAETLVGVGSEYVRAPRLTLVGEERLLVSKIIKDALANQPKY